MIFGLRVSAVLCAADNLGVADALAAGPRSGAEVAADVGANPLSLLRVMRGLAVIGVLDEVEPERFALTKMGSLMRSDVPGSVRGSAMFNADTRSMRTWGELSHTAKTGDPTFDHVWGMSAFEYFAQNPEINTRFNAAMAGGTKMSAPGIIAAYDFSRFKTIVDVGGGNGTLVATILNAVNGPRGIVQDTKAGSEDAPRTLEKAGVADRIDVDHRDFFESVTPGGDCYILKHIIHDWNDEESTTIFRNIRSVVPGGGRLLVIESVMPEKADTSDRSWMVVMADLNMLVNTHGRERMESQYRSLLSAGGFELLHVHPAEAPWPLSVIEAAPK